MWRLGGGKGVGVERTCWVNAVDILVPCMPWLEGPRCENVTYPLQTPIAKSIYEKDHSQYRSLKLDLVLI